MKILITGASSGLGAELARQYADREHELILLARRAERLELLREELVAKCKKVSIVAIDITAFELLQERVSEFENIDLLILNAGVSSSVSEELTSFENFKKLYDVNLFANHAILEVLLPKFKARKKGKIVFISSLASLISMPTAEAYSSSKRALNAYAEALRNEYTQYGLKIILILPGFIKSEMTAKNDFDMPFLLETKEGVKKIKKAIDQEKRYYAFPLRLFLFINFLKILPEPLFQKLLRLKKKST